MVEDLLNTTPTAEAVPDPTPTGEGAPDPEPTREAVPDTATTAKAVPDAASTVEAATDPAPTGEAVPDPATTAEAVPDPARTTEATPDPAPTGEPAPAKETDQVPKPCVHDQPYANESMRPAKLTLEATLNIENTGIYKYVPFVTGLAFLLDSRIVAVDSINKKCFILTRVSRGKCLLINSSTNPKPLPALGRIHLR